MKILADYGEMQKVEINGKRYWKSSIGLSEIDKKSRDYFIYPNWASPINSELQGSDTKTHKCLEDVNPDRRK